MKPKPYHSYKDSGIEWLGEVPEHWKVNRLKLHIKLNPSKKEISHFSKDTELSFIPMDNVGIDGSLVLDTVKPLFEVDSGYTYFREHDVAIAKITPCFENGKGCIFSNLTSGHGFGTTELTVMRPLNINPKYLYYITSSYSFKRIGESSMQGSAGQKRVPDEFIKEFRSPIPSIQEQRSIASFLDHEKARIDTLIQKKEQMIELLKEKRIALITQAVTKGLDPNVKMKDSGIEWLGEVPEHWKVKRLKYLSSVNDDSLPETTDPALEIVYVDIGNVSRTAGIVNKDEMLFENAPSRARRIVIDGDTIISTVRTYLRAITAIENPDQNLIVSTGFAVIRPQKITKDYLSLVLNSDYVVETIVSVSVGVSYPAVSPSDIGGIFVPYPPHDEQLLIASTVRKQNKIIDELQNKIEHSTTLLQEYRSSLIHSAVTGKIDLRGYHEEH